MIYAKGDKKYINKVKQMQGSKLQFCELQITERA